MIKRYSVYYICIYTHTELIKMMALAPVISWDRSISMAPFFISSSPAGGQSPRCTHHMTTEGICLDTTWGFSCVLWSCRFSVCFDILWVNQHQAMRKRILFVHKCHKCDDFNSHATGKVKEDGNWSKHGSERAVLLEGRKLSQRSI